ncbi:MAG: T9SS type A sorting domain-containing protein, partial [Flavobacteriales bacterium]
PCDDGDQNTTNSVLQGDCSCGGGAVCTEDLDLVIATDAGVDETTWEIVRRGTTLVVASGGPLSANAQLTADICLSAGCYELRVMDAAGDGMTSGTLGGYVLRDENGARIIDNTANGTFGSLSSIANNGGFCVPMGTDKLIYTSCDKLDWVVGNYIVAATNPAVSAQFGVTNTTSGYEFWFFNPNGGYSFRRFRDHATSDGFSPNNATRACHAKINNWSAIDQIPANMLMNVRVRGRVAGVNNEWGPACRFKIDPIQAACPLTKLMDIPGNPYLSCGATRIWGNGNYVYARPVTGATQYQFRFRIDAEGFLAVRTTSSYFVQLNWVSSPLLDGKTYQVEVRAFKNGAWCVGNAGPVSGPPFTPWGEVCDLTIDNTPINAGHQNLLDQENTTLASGLSVYPNPNRGEQLYLNLVLPNGIMESTTSHTASLAIFDATGKLAMATTLPIKDDLLNIALDVEPIETNGLYIVSIVVGDERFTARFVIER